MAYFFYWYKFVTVIWENDKKSFLSIVLAKHWLSVKWKIFSAPLKLNCRESLFLSGISRGRRSDDYSFFQILLKMINVSKSVG